MLFKLRSAVGISYLVGLHVLLACLVFKPDLLAQLPHRLHLVRPANPYVSDMLAYHFRMDESVPDGSDLFFGDSITQSLATAAVSGKSVNYGIGTLDTAQLLDALPAYRSLQRAGTVYLAIGINDFMRNRQHGITSRLQDILAHFPAEKPLVWSAIMPMARGTVARDEVIAVNRAIRQMCAARSPCTYVDTWALLAAPDGRGNAAYFLPDGAHLNTLGYATWIKALRAAAGVVSAAPDARATPASMYATPKIGA